MIFAPCEYRLSTALFPSGVCIKAPCGIFLLHRTHQIAAGKWLQTRLVWSEHSKNIHLVKMCEAGAKRNGTFGIKVSFCRGYHPVDGRETGEGGKERKNGSLKETKEVGRKDAGGSRRTDEGRGEETRTRKWDKIGMREKWRRNRKDTVRHQLGRGPENAETKWAHWQTPNTVSAITNSADLESLKHFPWWCSVLRKLESLKWFKKKNVVCNAFPEPR